jgi:tetratricopeptide (TPR) repeat protein
MSLKEVFDFVKEHFDPTSARVVIALILVASVTTFLVLDENRYVRVLVWGFCLVLGLFYGAIRCQNRRKRKSAIAFGTLGLLSAILWGVGFYQVLTSPHRQFRELIEAAHGFSGKGMFTEAAQKYTEAISVARDAKNIRDEIHATCEIGQCQFFSGQKDAALESFNSCKSLASEHNDAEGLSMAFVGLGQVAVRHGDLDLAGAQFRHAKDALQGSRYPVGQADVEIGLGSVAVDNGEAHQHYLRAEALYKAARMPLGEANVAEHMGQSEADPNLARQDYQHGLVIAQKFEDPFTQANLLYDLGKLEQRLSNKEDATKYYTMALTLYQQLNHRTGEASVLIGLGELEGNLGHYESARDYFLRAINLDQSEGDRAPC